MCGSALVWLVKYSWIWPSGLNPNTMWDRRQPRLPLATCVLYPDFTNRWSYVHETDDEVAMVKCPQAAGRANQIASVSVSITGGQLHKRNRPKSYLHLYSPSSSWTRSTTQRGRAKHLRKAVRYSGWWLYGNDGFHKHTFLWDISPSLNSIDKGWVRLPWGMSFAICRSWWDE